MASTVGPSPPSDHHPLSVESIPTVDLRLLSQSELTALSLCSSHSYDLRRCDDVVIPKIDRTIFNESAGSRKQTFSRLRLAPRNHSTPPPQQQPQPQPPVFKPRPTIDADNSRIITLFKNIFNNGDGNGDGNGNGNGDGDYGFDDDVDGNLVHVNVEYDDGEGLLMKRKREEEEEEEEEKEEKERELVNKKGEVVDLRELGRREDPYGEELRKRTQGKESVEELLGFVSGLDGVWGSTRKKRKIVDANMFGEWLPNGWKVLIAVKKKQGRAFLFCRRYVSPNGRFFVSCKEVSSYLLSLTSPEDMNQQTAVEGLEDEAADNKLASESATDLGNKIETPSLSIIPHSNDLENLQKPVSTSEIIDHEKQVGMLTNVLPGGPASSLKCHKCSSPFYEKDELLNHLLSCHKRKRRKSGAPIEEDIMMKDGKYECQFCNKVFNERCSYFGHVGIHVKNYVKSIGGSPGLTSVSKQKDSSLSEVNFYFADSKPEAGCEAQTHIENGVVFQNNIELSMEAAQNNKLSADISSAELDGTAHTTENNVREVEGGVDFSAMKPAACSGSDKENDNNNNIDLCEKFGEINASDCIDSEIIKASPEPVQMDEAELVSDSKAEDLGNDGNFSLQREREASEIDLLFENKETSSYDQNSEDRSMVNNTIEQSCFTVDLGLGDDDDDGRLINGSDNGHVDLDVDGGDVVQCPGNFDGTSDVLRKEAEACGITGNRVDFMKSPLTESNENGSFSLSGDQPNTDMQNFHGKVLIGRESGIEVDTCGLEDTERIVDAQKRPEACESLQSKSNACGYTSNEDETRGFHVEQICTVVNSPRELSSTKSEELKSDRVLNSGNPFFTPESNDRHLTAEVLSSNDQTHSDVSNLLGSFNNFVQNKQEEVAKNIFSGLSLNQHLREVSINNMTDAPSTTSPMSLPELDKVDTSRTNKLIFDFDSITDMNSRLLGSVQNETIPQGTSPFSLWEQQTCTMEDDQNRAYGNARGLVQQERASDNNLLNLVGLQQPSNAGFNLNKVHRNEQRYGVQNNETMTEGMSHGNTLNLAGFQQQCDTGYNLNKSCINQQSYGMQCNETGAYNTSNESKQERVTTYGNSLSLASVPQTCEPRYNMNKVCMPQTCDTGFGLNKGYMGTMQELSKLDEIRHSRDQNLMIGFGNSGGRPNQNVANDFWRGAEGSILPGGLMDSSSRGQPSGSYQAFDFLSDKGGNDLYAANDKFDNISSFEGLRPTPVEPMEFSFLTPQDPNLHLGHKNALPYNNAPINQGFGSSVWHQKPTLPNMMSGHVVNTLCVWCGNEFHQDSLSCEIQAGSIGYLCPTCKARMSGQFL